MNNEIITGKQDQQHLQQSDREISKKGTQEKHSIYVTDLVKQSMKDQKLQEITEKYGKVIDQELQWYHFQDSPGGTVIGINKTNKYIAKKYEYEANSDVFLI